MTPRIYQLYIIKNYLKTVLIITFVFFSAIFVLNIFEEISYFKESDKKIIFPIILTFLNAPSILYEIFPFIFLISTQFFFIRVFDKDELNVFKNFGITNYKIIKTITFTSLLLGIFIVTIFYNLSSKFKYIYFDLKSGQSKDNKYLAVITNNGLWIRDMIDDRINIINASKIDKNFLIDTIISEFDNNFNPIRNIRSEKINIESKNWYIYEPRIFDNKSSSKQEFLNFKSNFDYQKIQNLYSNLSSLSLAELYELRKNYKLLNYSTTETDMQIHKILSYPIYLMLMTILSGIIMFNTKNFKNTTIKLAIGLFLSVIIYYINNFFYVIGNTEKLSLVASIWLPLMFLGLINIITLRKINAK